MEGCPNGWRCPEHKCKEEHCVKAKSNGTDLCSEHLYKVLVNIAKHDWQYVPNDIWNKIGEYWA
jgi:hypothetical protein